MYNVDQINTECKVFTQYLMGHLPDKYILEKYSTAFSPGQPLGEDLQSNFDTLLIKLAVIHPLFTHAIDAFSRFFYNDSTLRKRLILLLALLESQASTSAEMDYPLKTGFMISILSMVLPLTQFFIFLIIATITLLPLKLLMKRSSV